MTNKSSEHMPTNTLRISGVLFASIFLPGPRRRPPLPVAPSPTSITDASGHRYVPATAEGRDRNSYATSDGHNVHSQ
eukprot:384817-Pyramimonas_sp.AAC.1